MRCQPWLMALPGRCALLLRWWRCCAHLHCCVNGCRENMFPEFIPLKEKDILKRRRSDELLFLMQRQSDETIDFLQRKTVCEVVVTA